MEILNTVFFYILSIICVISAIYCLFQKNIKYAAIGAIVLFLSLSCLYFGLNAPYLALLQILFQGAAGALMLLLVAITFDGKTSKSSSKISLKAIAAPVVGIFFAIIIIPLILYGFGGFKTLSQHSIQDFATILFKNNILSFSAVTILIVTVITGFFAILANKINKIKSLRLVKTPQNKKQEGGLNV